MHRTAVVPTEAGIIRLVKSCCASGVMALLGACTGDDSAGKDDAGPDSGEEPGSAEVASVLSGGVLALVALDPADGAEIWQAPAGTTYQALHAAGGALYGIEKDQRYVTIAYDTATGAERFRVEGEDDDLTPGPLVTDGMLITGWADNTIAGIDVTAPESPTWTFSALGTPAGQGAVVAGHYVFGDDEGHVYAVDPATGAAVWQADLNGAVVAGVVATADKVYTATSPATVVAIDGSSGDVSWDTDIGPGDSWGLVDAGGGRVYAATTYALENVVSIDAASGDIVWRADAITSGQDGGVRITEQGLLLPTYGNVSLLDSEDGRTLWMTGAGAGAVTVPIVMGDSAYFSGYGTLAKLDIPTGTVDWWLSDEDLFGGFAAPSLLLDDGSAVNATDPRE